MADGATEVLSALALAGMLGSAGQTVRAIGGLKKMSDSARGKGVAMFDEFSPSRFVVSLVVGFVAGLVAALALDPSKLNFHDNQVLLGLAAAGYGGTDFIEAFARRIIGPSSGAPQVQLVTAPAVPAPMATPVAQPAPGRRGQPRQARRGRARR
jgi:putative chitinase